MTVQLAHKEIARSHAIYHMYRSTRARGERKEKNNKLERCGLMVNLMCSYWMDVTCKSQRSTRPSKGMEGEIMGSVT